MYYESVYSVHVYVKNKHNIQTIFSLSYIDFVFFTLKSSNTIICGSNDKNYYGDLSKIRESICISLAFRLKSQVLNIHGYSNGFEI